MTSTTPISKAQPRPDSAQDAKLPFLTDVLELRRRAREHIEQGAITAAYKGDRQVIVDLLNQALATELVCVLRYKRHYFMASGINAEAVAQEFSQHATEEQGHADEIAARITQLQGMPNFDPEGLTNRSHAQYDASEDLDDMIKEDLIAERVAIASYQEIIRWLANDDPVTRALIETILAVEEEHADDLLNFLQEMGK
jgi:bacterioferritin